MTDRRPDHRASFTAQTCAARLAAETLQPSSVRLLNDPYARHFVSDPVLRACLIHPLAARAFIGLANSVYGRVAHLFTVLRVRYIDEVAATPFIPVSTKSCCWEPDSTRPPFAGSPASLLECSRLTRPLPRRPNAR